MIFDWILNFDVALGAKTNLILHPIYVACSIVIRSSNFLHSIILLISCIKQLFLRIGIILRDNVSLACCMISLTIFEAT